MGDFRFLVLGVPRPQGSKRLLRHKATGKLLLIESSNKLHAWRKSITLAAKACNGAPLVGPVGMEMVFSLPTPRRRKQPLPTTRPDLDKLDRAVLDALTGVCYEDDSQVVDIYSVKRYGQFPGLSCRVYRVDSVVEPVDE